MRTFHLIAAFGATMRRLAAYRGSVRLDRILPERWLKLANEMAKFGTIGVINLFVNFAVFNLLLATILSTSEVKAKAAATVVATTCAYFMNRHWTYRDRPKSTLRREYSLFFFFNLVGLLIEVTVVGLTKYGFGLTHIIALNIAGGLGICLGTIFRFWAYRTHVFRPAIAAPVTTEAAAPETGSATASALETTMELTDDLDTELSDELTDIELAQIVADAQRRQDLERMRSK